MAYLEKKVSMNDNSRWFTHFSTKVCSTISNFAVLLITMNDEPATDCQNNISFYPTCPFKGKDRSKDRKNALYA